MHDRRRRHAVQLARYEKLPSRTPNSPYRDNHSGLMMPGDSASVRYPFLAYALSCCEALGCSVWSVARVRFSRQPARRWGLLEGRITPPTSASPCAITSLQFDRSRRFKIAMVLGKASCFEVASDHVSIKEWLFIAAADNCCLAYSYQPAWRWDSARSGYRLAAIFR